MIDIYVLMEYFFIIALVIGCILWGITLKISPSILGDENFALFAFFLPIIIFFIFAFVILGPSGFWHFLQIPI